MRTQRELRENQETPERLDKDGDGRTRYPRTEEGSIGDSYTLSERERAALPPIPPLDLNNPDRHIHRAAAAGMVGTGAALVAREQGNQRPPLELPPYVQANKGEQGTTYIFVAPQRAREAGFEASTVLGVDDGSGAGLSGITERAWALASDMETRIKAMEERLINGGMSAEERARRAWDGPYIPPHAVMIVGYDPGSREVLAHEVQQAEDLRYHAISDEMARHQLDFHHVIEPPEPIQDAAHHHPLHDEDRGSRSERQETAPLVPMVLAAGRGTRGDASVRRAKKQQSSPKPAARKRKSAVKAAVPIPPGTTPEMPAPK